MNGIQFKALQAAAGLIYPDDAAWFLNVTIPTVEDWRTDRSPIPAWAAARLRARVAELAGEPPDPGEEDQP